MRSPNDPVRVLRRQTMTLMGGGVVVLLGLLLWALAPLPEISPPSVVVAPIEVDATEPDAVAVLDAQMFDIALWNPPPPPVEAGTEKTQSGPPPPPPVRLQLIGIIAESELHRAVLYDPSTDRLHIVTNGERINRFTIKSVTARTVVLASDADPERTVSLQLKSAKEGMS